MGYSKEDLKETYGFMLLDDISEVQSGNSDTPTGTMFHTYPPHVSSVFFQRLMHLQMLVCSTETANVQLLEIPRRVNYVYVAHTHTQHKV